MGYFAIQATRPQTLGYALADSPAGQAAWIYDISNGGTGDLGRPEDALTREQMLDEITLFWLTNTAASSARISLEQMRVWRRLAMGKRTALLSEGNVRGRPQTARGVGTRLLTQLMKKQAAESVRQISLGTERDKPAKDFYRKLGFEIEQEIIFMEQTLAAAGDEIEHLPKELPVRPRGAQIMDAHA